MQRQNLISTRTRKRAQRLWLQYGVFWLGAIAVGLIAVLYARLADWSYALFMWGRGHNPLLPLLMTPAICAGCVWLTLRYCRGAEGSGIPQAIASLEGPPGIARGLMTMRILIGKVLVSLMGLMGGLTIGREGPTIHMGAALMYNLRVFYPKHFRARRGQVLEQRLILAGSAAGLSAAFNAPLAGIVFVLEELTHSFEFRKSGVITTAIVFAGIVSLGIQGDYTYFGTLNIGAQAPATLALSVILIGIIAGLAGGIFCWLLLHTDRWMPSRLHGLRLNRPVAFAGACGLLVAVLGVLSSGHTFGSGYTEARAMIDGDATVSVLYPLMKMASLMGSYLSGIPGGLFAPCLAIGAGIGNTLHAAFSELPLPMLISLGMVAYLAAVTQSPITAFVIVTEMTSGHELVIPLLATALIATRFSKLFAPPLYEALSKRYFAGRTQRA